MIDTICVILLSYFYDILQYKYLQMIYERLIRDKRFTPVFNKIYYSPNLLNYCDVPLMVSYFLVKKNI